MKYPLYLSILGLTLLSSCVCQNIGLKAGPNISTISGDDTGNLDPKIGFFVGGHADLCLTEDVFTITPEIQFSRQGAKYNDSDGFDGEFELDYVNVPVLAKVNLSEELMIEAGPHLGFLVSAKDKYESPAESGTDDIKDDLKGIDFGANIGLFYQFNNGWNLGARYSQGLTNINDFEGSGDIKNRNSVLQFSLGFRF